MHRQKIIETLRAATSVPEERRGAYFKTAVGDYAEHDRFIGISVPELRKIAKEYAALPIEEIDYFIASPFNEERLFALFILVDQYKRGNIQKKEEIYHYYLSHTQHINNWNLVDSSAHLIVGYHLYTRDRKMLLELAQSKNMWERRIAIVATWYFIKQKDLEWTFKIAERLLQDKHDLIHKAVGWMLREAGKKEEAPLIAFLDLHSKNMPRTMFRYSIERLPHYKK